MFPNYLLKLFFSLLTGLFLHLDSYSQYADLGSGALKDRIWWVDWNGFSIANGATKTFMTSNGLNVSITFSNVSGPLLTPSVMNTWYGSVLHLLYNFSNASIKPALYHSSYQTIISKFTISITATRNNIPVPIQFIAADAEASAVTEITTLKTNGSAWNTVDFFRNSSQTSNPLTGCNTNTVQISDTYGNTVATGQNPVISTQTPSGGPLVIDITLDHSGINGQMGLAFGVLEAVDRGDLPATFGHAQHRINYTYNNVCNYLPPFPSAVQSTNLKLGIMTGDADGIQSVNDNALGTDEDALNTFPIYSGNGNYTLSLPLTNTTGSDAYLSAWFDINGNGSFEIGESQVVTVPNNAASISFTWTGLPSAFSYTNKYGFRFRLSSDLVAVTSAYGYAKDGEVEDYHVNIPQIVVANFSMPDTVCKNTPVHITNMSTGASSYFWNFCSPNPNTVPIGTNLGNVGGQLNKPSYLDCIIDGGNYFCFLVNNSGVLIRLDYGNSILNTPITTNLGTLGGVIPQDTKGLQVVKNEGKWYIIIVGGNPNNGIPSRILKIELGTNITNNAPSSVDWGNLGNLSFPQDLILAEDGGNWYGLTVNKIDNTITRFDFTNSFSNIPVSLNLGNIGALNAPVGINVVKEGSNWFAFVTNSGSNALSRLDFGSSLSNTPTGINLGNINGKLQSPSDIFIMKYCGENVGFLVNAMTNDLVKLEFGSSITSITTATSIGNLGNMNSPGCLSKIIRDGASLYAFISNMNNNTITRLNFNGCINSSVQNSTMQNPPPITYNTPGVYNVSLTVDEGLPTQTAFCKSIVVVESINSSLQRKTFCSGDSIQLVASGSNGVIWNTGSTQSTIYVRSSGKYWATSSVNDGCLIIDSFEVSEKSNPHVNLGKDTSFCLSDSLVLDAGNPGATYLWQNQSNTQSIIARNEGLYYVTVTRDGCIGRDTILLALKPSPIITLSSDTTICRSGSAILSAGGGTSYLWSPSTGLSDSTSALVISKVDSTITYHLTITNSDNCKAKDSVTVTVIPKPVFSVESSKPFICVSDSTILTANGGDKYTWSPSSSLSHPNNNWTFAFPITTTTYKVVIEDSNCRAIDSLTIDLPVYEKPNVTVSKSNDISCNQNQAILSADGGVGYLWSPSTGLSNATIKNPVVSIAIPTTYYVMVRSQEGCESIDSITVDVIGGDKSNSFLVPNAFTPNGDGKNDCFGVKWGAVSDFSLKLFNRWGEIVYQTTDPNQCWNGIYKGILQPTDVFVYLITAKTICGDIFRKGTFTLIK